MYDTEARRGKSNHYGWYKGYKAQVCSTLESVALSYALTTENVNDSKIAPVLLRDIQTEMCCFPLRMLVMIVSTFMKLPEPVIFSAVNPINPRNGEQIKNTHPPVLSHFAQTNFGKQLMKERGEIEQQFSKLKDKGLEKPRWYGQNCYLLHVQLVLLIHHITYVF